MTEAAAMPRQRNRAGEQALESWGLPPPPSWVAGKQAVGLVVEDWKMVAVSGCGRAAAAGGECGGGSNSVCARSSGTSRLLLLPDKSQMILGRPVPPPELPEDIIMCVFAALEIPDLIRAGSVCSSWHSAYTRFCNLGLFKQSQTPCLLYTSESAGESVAGLYSLAEKKSYTLTLPDPPIRSRYVIGSNHGWIVTADTTSELHLVNPITGDQITLPSVTTIEPVKPIYDDAGAIQKYEYSWYNDADEDYGPPSILDLGELRNYLFHKAFLSSDPSTGSYYIVLIHGSHNQLSFARSGDDKWTRLPPHIHYYSYVDCMFKDDLFYASTPVGEILGFDIKGPAIMQKVVLEEVKDYIRENIYIAQAPNGDLLQIWRDRELIENDEDVSESELDSRDEELIKNDEDVSESELDSRDEELIENDEDVSESELDSEHDLNYANVFKVHKVDLPARKLVEISNLGENVLFLGHNPSLCLHADEYPQLKANHVYFTDGSEYLSFRQNKHRDIGVLNIENNSSEEIVSPELWSNWPAPVWVIPNPRKMNSVSHN